MNTLLEVCILSRADNLENFFLFSAEGDEKSLKKNEEVKSNNSLYICTYFVKYSNVMKYKIFDRYSKIKYS